MKQFGNPPFLRQSPLSTKRPISEQFFHDAPLCPNVKNEITPPPKFGRGDYDGTQQMSRNTGNNISFH